MPDIAGEEVLEGNYYTEIPETHCFREKRKGDVR